MKLKDHYREDSVIGILHEIADNLARDPASGDAKADAIDRLTIAIYRVGATIADNEPLAPVDFREELDGIKYAITDLAEAVSKLPKSN